MHASMVTIIFINTHYRKSSNRVGLRSNSLANGQKLLFGK